MKYFHPNYSNCCKLFMFFLKNKFSFNFIRASMVQFSSETCPWQHCHKLPQQINHERHTKDSILNITRMGITRKICTLPLNFSKKITWRIAQQAGIQYDFSNTVIFMQPLFSSCALRDLAKNKNFIGPAIQNLFACWCHGSD